ncbi:MAG: NADH-quinone oxidoreductase subunit NuoG [Gammaproteobacteria bacterium]
MSAQIKDKPENSLNIEIDGVPLTARQGDMIIHAADEAGIHIPRFCYHKKLPIAANCRMCLVEVEMGGRPSPKPMPACATPLADGMKVFTKSELALSAQRAVMEFLLINHPLDCPICDQGGECELQDISMGFGGSVSRFTERKRVVPDPELGSLIATDMTRCIHCMRCVRALELVGGQMEIGATGRGENTRVGTYVQASVDSEMSGNVIDVCPVGALTSKPFRFKARTWELMQASSIAPHDCVGSNVSVHTLRGSVIRVVPRENEAVNEVWLSDRDRFSYEGLNSDARLTKPRVKDHGSWKDTDWDTALTAAVSGLKDVLESAGPDEIGFLISPSATVEEMYLAKRIADAMGCPNIDHRLRQGDFRDDAAMDKFPSLGLSIEAVEQLGSALLVGSNLRKEQPILNHRLRKAAKAGAAISSVNPAAFDLTMPMANELIASPAAMVAELAGIATALGVELPQWAGDINPSDAQRAVADSLKSGAPAAVILGEIALGSAHGAEMRSLARAISDAAGASFGYLTPGANSTGAWMAGAVPHRGVAGASVQADGLNARGMVEAPRKAYVMVGFDPALDTFNGPQTLAAMDEAAFVVALSAYSSEALDKAHVQFPVAPFTETAGTFVNCEGRWQSFKGIAKSKGDSRPAWKVLRVLGNLLDIPGFDYMDVKEVRDELARKCDGMESSNALEEVEGLEMPAQQGLSRVGAVSIYGVDAITRQAPSLSQTKDAQTDTILISPATAKPLDVADGVRVNCTQNGVTVTLRARVDDSVAASTVILNAAAENTAGLGPSYGPIELEKA